MVKPSSILDKVDVNHKSRTNQNVLE
jgi:hypothetical protein